VGNPDTDLAKHPNADVHLAEYIRGARSFPSEYGLSDCIMFAAGGVEVQTGKDLAAPFRHTYSTQAEAARVMVANGWATVDDVASAFLPSREIWDVRRGDVVAVDSDNGRCLGIYFNGVVWVMTDAGAISIPAANIKAAWKVG